jgi:hypothetical protein
VQSFGNVVAIAGGKESEGNVAAKCTLDEMMERAITTERNDASISHGCSLCCTLSQVLRALGTNKIRLDTVLL